MKLPRSTVSPTATRAGIVHLSHTDIRYDARILKELGAVASLPGVTVLAIGVDHDEGAAAGMSPQSVRIETIGLKTRRLRWLHGALRHGLNLVELAVRVTPRAVRAKPVIVHCHDTLVLPIGALVKMFTGCALVYDAHELESEKNGQSRMVSRVTIAMEWICWRYIDVLVSVSQPILDWYAARFGVKRSVLVLNSPLTAPYSRGSSESPRLFHEKFRIPHNRKVFLYLGILAPGRGIPLLLEAFGSRDVQSHIVFVGYRDGVGVGEASKQAGNIHLHPPVPHSEVVEFARAADFGVCLIEDVSLSDRYCLPNKLFEYAFAGLPILASDLPEIRRTVIEHHLGVCCRADADDVLRAISELESGDWHIAPSAFSKLGWDAQAERLKNAYRDLLRSKRASCE